MNRLSILSILTCCILMSDLSQSQAANITERQVTFKGANGATLAGTLELPAGASANSKVPALLLLAGSGPTDRNGNQPPAMVTDLLKQIAQGLAAHGIASLRYDKRGMYANSAEWPKDRSQYGTFLSWENIVGDTTAGYRFLRDQPEIDPAHVGILGHSEGGLLALTASKDLDAEPNPPSVLILLSTSGRTFAALIEEQLQDTLAQQGATADQTQYFLSENKRISEAICTTGKVPADVPPGLAPLYPFYMGDYLQKELPADPLKLVEAFPRPVLVMNGASDTQVSPDRDAKALDQALKGRTGDDHLLVIVPNASHNYKVVHAPGDPGITGDVAPDALTQLETWAAAKLGAHAAP